MEILEIGQPLAERKRTGPPEQLPLLWEESETPASVRMAARAASERDAAIERESQRAKVVVLTLLGAILLVSHFL